MKQRNRKTRNKSNPYLHVCLFPEKRKITLASLISVHCVSILLNKILALLRNFYERIIRMSLLLVLAKPFNSKNPEEFIGKRNNR